MKMATSFNEQFGEKYGALIESIGWSQIRALYNRYAHKIRILVFLLFVVLGTFLTIKKFSGAGESPQFMQKITEYINKEMDRILLLKTRDEQNDEFRELKPKLPIDPVRMTLTTAVFKYTSTNPMVILKRIILNPANALNEDYMSTGLKNANIVKTLKTFRTKRVLPDGKEQTLLWIFSEYLDVKLSQKTVRGNEKKIRDILEGALKGLVYMHSLSIAHLDLKIGNIMGKTTPSGVVYKLIDFGYSQIMPASGSVEIPNKNYGTYPYKPPEIVFRNTHGIKSDIWSLGSICWFLSLQYTPFYFDNFKKDLAAYKRFLNSPEKDAANHRFTFSHGSSNALKSFVKACMQIDPEKRPSARELLSHPFITGRPHDGYHDSRDEIDDEVSSSSTASASSH